MLTLVMLMIGVRRNLSYILQGFIQMRGHKDVQKKKDLSIAPLVIIKYQIIPSFPNKQTCYH